MEEFELDPSAVEDARQLVGEFGDRASKTKLRLRQNSRIDEDKKH